MSLTRLTKVEPSRDRLSELEALTGSTRYRIHVNSVWLFRYLECFPRHRSAFLLEARDSESGNLAAALPLEILEVRNERGWKMRQLVPLAGAHSDFVPLLCLPGKEAEFGCLVAGWLAGKGQEWESLRMNVIPQSSRGWAEFAQALGGSGFTPKVSQDRFFYKVNTDGWWEDYEKNFLHRRMDTVRNLTNQMTRDCGGKEVRILDRGIDDHLAEFVTWYRQRREATDQKDAFENYPEKLGFLRSVIRDFEPRGLVRLSVLTGGGDTLAYQLDWLDQGIWYYYMPAFNDRFARYSPSKILLYETMKLAFNDPKIHEFNFMRGEEPYKAQFANEKEAFISIRVTNPRSFRSRAIAALSRAALLRDRILRRRPRASPPERE